MGELRVLSYNVRSLRDDRDAVAAVIRACAPDVVLVQEAPRFLRWRSKRAALARLSRMVVGTADRTGGLLVMTSMRVRVLDTSFTRLPKAPRLHQRVVVAATVDVGGETWRVASVHLSLDDDERRAHMPGLWEALRPDDDVPLVVAGDVNERPDGVVWRELASRLQDAYVVAPAGPAETYSSARPHKRIDAVFVDKRVEVVECRAVHDVPGVTRASDHLPVLAVLRHP
jgi:endonuclease/exonuclease/phosphatase family metal-dependent hydrolase